MEIIEALEQIEQHLHRIADALDADRPAPDYRYPLAAYPGYDWSGISAEILEQDDSGATRIMWQRRTYTRRSNPKYGHGVWFSRGAGRDDEGNAKYERLITFSVAAAVEPLNVAITAGLAIPPPEPGTSPTAAPPAPTPTPTADPPSELDRFFPREGEQPARPETARTRFFQLLPVAIAAGLAPDIANSLTALGRRASYTEALTTLEQHIEQLEAATV